MDQAPCLIVEPFSVRTIGANLGIGSSITINRKDASHGRPSI